MGKRLDRARAAVLIAQRLNSQQIAECLGCSLASAVRLRSELERPERLPDLPGEIWRLVPWAPIYEVSNLGRLRRIGGRYRLNGKCVGEDQRGKYITVTLSGRQIGLHRLVCETFHGPAPTPTHDAAHNDGNRRNNREDNLRWATRSENNRDQDKHGTRFRPRGERSGHARLTEADIQIVIAMRGRGDLHREIAEHFDVCRTTISAVLNGYNWKHATGGKCHAQRHERTVALVHSADRAA
jgi:hypothetical protein